MSLLPFNPYFSFNSAVRLEPAPVSTRMFFFWGLDQNAIEAQPDPVSTVRFDLGLPFGLWDLTEHGPSVEKKCAVFQDIDGSGPYIHLTRTPNIRLIWYEIDRGLQRCMT